MRALARLSGRFEAADSNAESQGTVMYLLALQNVRKSLLVALVLAFGSLATQGQDGTPSNREAKADVLTIVNPNHIDVPDERARILLLTTYRLVADEFHRRPQDVEVTMTLVLGARDEHYAIDKEGRMTMYLERWDEPKFVNGVITSATQWLAPLHLRNQMFTEILRRTDQIAPVSADQLRRPTGISPLPTGEYPTCTSEMATTPCSALTPPPRPSARRPVPSQ